MNERDSILPRYRTFWRRFFASLIDGILFLPLYLIEDLIVFGGQDFYFLAGRSPDRATSVETIILVTTINIVCIAVYSIWLTGIHGQTLGKMIMRIKVVDEADEESNIGLRRAFYRDAPLVIAEFAAIILMLVTYDASETSVAMRILDFAVFVWFLGELISMFQNVRRRAIHDYLADSVVIKTGGEK